MMDKRSILAVLLTAGIWIGWQKLYLEPYQQKAAQEQQLMETARLASLAKNKTQATNLSAPVATGKVAVSASTSETVKSSELSEEHYSLGLSNQNTVLKNWVLKSYTKSLTDTADTINLQYVTGFADQLRLRFSDDTFQNLNDKNWGDFTTSASGERAKLVEPQVSLERSFTANPTGYYGDLEYKFHFTSTPPKFVFVDLRGSPKRPHDKEGSIFGQIPDKVKFTFRDSTQRKSVIADNLKEPLESSAGVRWLGIDTRYFVFAITPTTKELRDTTGLQIEKDFEAGVQYVRGSLVVPTNGQKDFSVPLKVYFGPKHLEDLNAADPILTDAIDFGWTTPISLPLLKALKWIYEYVHNYGLAIILLTFLIKVALFPLTYKSMKSMAKMSKLQPQLNALREKYKDNKEKLNTEMMGFMKSNGYNPVSGCLPMVLQMPIFFALYRVFFNSMELYQAPFMGWIHDLSSPDPFYVTPVLLAGLMFVQQRISPNAAADPAQQKMMQLMPVIFGMFMLLLPSGLTIYMVVNSLMTILQQFVLNKRFGIRPRMGSASQASA